jgi:hypothetical protein
MKEEVKRNIQVHELFEYKEGDIFWKIRPGGRVKVGDKAGTITSNNYRFVWSQSVFYGVHRIVYMMHYGEIPDGMEIDHIDGDTLNNRIENLRLVTPSQNCWNRGKQKDNKSGFKGVRKISGKDYWQAHICTNRVNKYLGSFYSPEAAYDAYKKAAKELHGEFSKLD